MDGIDFSKGNIIGLINRQAGPLLLAEVTNACYSIVDKAFVGQISEGGDAAIAGIGIVYPLITIFTAVIALFRTGAAPLCSIARGKKDAKRAEQIMSQCFAFLLISSVMMMGLLFLFKKPILYLFGATDNTFMYANNYISVYQFGIIFSAISLGGNSFITLQGFPKYGMFTTIVGAICNILLDPIFIYKYQMGVTGAALATVLAQFLSAACVAFFFIKGRGELEIRRDNLFPRKKYFIDIITLGSAGFFMKITGGLVAIITNRVVKAYGGDEYIGIMTIVSTLQDVLFLFIFAFGDGAKPILSYNYGSKEYKRIKQAIKYLTIIYLIYSAVATVMMFFGAEIIASFFTVNRETVEKTSEMMKIYFSIFVFTGFQSTGQNFFQAIGQAKFASFFAIFRKVGLVIPLLLLLPKRFGIDGVFWANPLSELVSGVLCYTTMIVFYKKNLGGNKKADEDRFCIKERFN